MLYAMTGVRAVSAVPGCNVGHTYEERPDKNDPHMSIDCPAHVAHHAKDPLWSPSPAHVPLNDAEKKAAEEAKAGQERAMYENAASNTEALGSITRALGALADRLDAMQLAQAPAAVPEQPAPAAVTPEPAAKARARKPRATAGAPA